MAKFEDQGYCPANALQMRAMQSGNPIADRVLSGLGSRVQFMVYPYDNIPSEEALVLPLLGTALGFRVAGVLRDLIPECTYPEIGRKIEIRDVDNFEEMIWSAIILTGDGFHVSFDEEGETVVMKIMTIDS